MTEKLEEKEKSERSRGITSLIGGIVTGIYSPYNLGCGLHSIIRYNLTIDSVRDTIYTSADKITPEVIQQANEVISQVSREGLHSGMISMAIAGFFAATSYFLLRRADKHL